MAIREEIVVATKVFHALTEGPNCRGLSRKHIFEACDASLKRLNMNYIDVYQIHRFDNETPIGMKSSFFCIIYLIISILEETMEALNDLVRSGKVLIRIFNIIDRDEFCFFNIRFVYIGASSMYAWQFAKAQHIAEKNGLDKIYFHAKSL